MNRRISKPVPLTRKGVKPQMQKTKVLTKKVTQSRRATESTVRGKVPYYTEPLSTPDATCDPSLGDPSQNCCAYGTFYSDKAKKCCNDGDRVVDGRCCPAGSSYSGDGDLCCDAGTDPAQHCCPFGQFYSGSGDKCCNDGDIVDNGHCCPAGSSYAASSDTCCDAGSDPAQHCCPYGTFYSGHDDTCCNDGDIYQDGHCCPANSAYSKKLDKCCDIGADPAQQCCPYGTFYAGTDDKCCNDGDTVISGHCCPAGSSFSTDGELCCPAGTDAAQHCCPFGTYYSGHDDKCCNDGDIYESGMCCTIGEVYGKDGKICGQDTSLASNKEGLSLPSSGHDFSSDNGAVLIVFAAIVVGLLLWFRNARHAKLYGYASIPNKTRFSTSPLPSSKGYQRADAENEAEVNALL